MERPVEYTLPEKRNLLLRMACCSRLLRAGRATRVFVNGDALDMHTYFDGCHNWIHVLGPDGRPIDQLRMRDQFGHIVDVQAISRHEISFGYFGTNDRWRLRVDEAEQA